MFRRKPKTRIERARQDIIKFRRQADDRRKDVVKQLNRSAKHLRNDIEQLLEGEERNHAIRLAKELEHMAQDIEERAGSSLGEVSQTASDNIWVSMLVAFVIGLAIGLLLKNMNK